MKLQTVSKTGVGSSSAIVMNTNVTPFNVGFGVIVSGTFRLGSRTRLLRASPRIRTATMLSR
jgi:hypothetical protein